MIRLIPRHAHPSSSDPAAALLSLLQGWPGGAVRRTPATRAVLTAETGDRRIVAGHAPVRARTVPANRAAAPQVAGADAASL